MLRSLFASAAVAVIFVACSSTNDTTTSDAGTNKDAAGGDAGPSDSAPATCSSPGQATPGPADTHCTDTDGGAIVQPTSMASCHTDAGMDMDGGMMGCPYGDTMFGMEADDDDCKYHVKWTASPICEGSAGVTFTVVATNKTDNSPLTGAGTIAETFTTTPGDASCDNASTHPGPNSGVVLAEGPPGTYKGNVVFDQAGAWTVRFHFHEECDDTLDDSPHGHAAFHLTVP